MRSFLFWWQVLQGPGRTFWNGGQVTFFCAASEPEPFHTKAIAESLTRGWRSTDYRVLACGVLVVPCCLSMLTLLVLLQPQFSGAFRHFHRVGVEDHFLGERSFFSFFFSECVMWEREWGRGGGV